MSLFTITDVIGLKRDIVLEEIISKSDQRCTSQQGLHHIRQVILN